MEFTGERMNSCTELQMLAWVQEVSLVLTNTPFEDFQDICGHVVVFLETNTQLFFMYANSFS